MCRRHHFPSSSQHTTHSPVKLCRLDPSSMSYNHNRITAASIWTRDKLSGPNLVGHWGVVVSVEGFGNYLIHNTPSTGTIAVDARQMSSDWTSVGSFPVGSGKTIRGCMQASGGAATKYVSSPFARYAMGMTCVGTMASVFQYLQS